MASSRFSARTFEMAKGHHCRARGGRHHRTSPDDSKAERDPSAGRRSHQVTHRGEKCRGSHRHCQNDGNHEEHRQAHQQTSTERATQHGWKAHQRTRVKTDLILSRGLPRRVKRPKGQASAHVTQTLSPRPDLCRPTKLSRQCPDRRPRRGSRNPETSLPPHWPGGAEAAAGGEA